MMLADFAALPLDQLQAEIERMLHQRAVRYYPSTLLTPAASAERTTIECTDAVAAGAYSETPA